MKTSTEDKGEERSGRKERRDARGEESGGATERRGRGGGFFNVRRESVEDRENGAAEKANVAVNVDVTLLLYICAMLK